MFIIYVVDLSTKSKMQRRGFIFLQKSKIKTVKNKTKQQQQQQISYFISENPNFLYLLEMLFGEMLFKRV